MRDVRQSRNWQTGLPPEAMFSIQRGSLKYSYKGIPMLKNPFDCALYSLLLWNHRPRSIIEIGSYSGGSAVWLGDLLNNFEIDGHVHSFDIRQVTNVSHPRVTFRQADARNLSATVSAEFLGGLPRPWLIIEDSDHFSETTRHVLQFFHPHLQPEEYFVIEDGIVADMGESDQYHGGPQKAVQEFMAQHGEQYEIDTRYCDFFGHNFTWCTNGYLHKLRV